MKYEVGWFRNQRVHLQLAKRGLIAWGDDVREATQKSKVLYRPVSSLCHNSDTRSKEGVVRKFGRYRG